MSTYVLMRILESAPRRYELGIRLLTLGRVERAYDRLASQIEPGQRVLDLGCGTGALSIRAARRGAKVKGIDVNPEMLAIAREHAEEARVEEAVELVETGVAELDAEPADSYDAVISGLCFSELSDDELGFTLEQVARILRPGGLLLVADEVKPLRFHDRVLHSLLRAPLAALTYLVTQQTTRALRGLPGRLAAAGLPLVSFTSSALGSFGEFVARKPAGALP
jgi:demethylmenaquinone methyltransferase/2-methoxy-6-polyprenyl-1,4-benzoquinol methylase